MVNPWSSSENQDEREIVDQSRGLFANGQVQVSHQPFLLRMIRGTGNILSQTRHKLATWYNDIGEQSHAPHINI